METILQKKIENVCYFGDYDTNYSRNKILIKGLKENHINVIECNDISNGILKYLNLYIKHKKIKNSYNYLIIGYSNNRFMPILAKFISRKKIIWDPLYSTYDSFVYDRKLIKKYNPKAFLYWILEFLSCRLVDIILLDTNEHIKYFSNLFKINKDKFVRVFVGSINENNHFDKSENDKFTVGFYGKYIPLQGIEYIIRSAKILEKEIDIQFVLIGNGQTYNEVIDLANMLGLRNVNFIKRIPYTNLIKQVSKFDICLGIFGNTNKALRVIPNKIYDSISLRKPIISSDTPAIRELFEDKKNILLCERASEKDLAKKIIKLKEDKKLREKISFESFNLFRYNLSPNKIVNLLLSDVKNILN